jgi:hypothetical protein
VRITVTLHSEIPKCFFQVTEPFSHRQSQNYVTYNQSPWPLVRKRTIPTERPYVTYIIRYFHTINYIVLLVAVYGYKTCSFILACWTVHHRQMSPFVGTGHEISRSFIQDIPACVASETANKKPPVRLEVFTGGDYEECRLLGYKTPVRTSQETHYLSATEASRLMLCKIWGFHGGGYEECHLLGCYAVWLL